MAPRIESYEMSVLYRGFHIVATPVVRAAGGFRCNCVVSAPEEWRGSFRCDSSEAFRSRKSALSYGIALAKRSVDRELDGS